MAYLSAESESEQCTPSIRSISAALGQHHQAVAAAMLGLLGTLDTMADVTQSSVLRETALQGLPAQLDELTTAVKNMCSACSSKASMESRLPNAPASNDMLASSFSKTTVALERLTQRLHSQSYLLSGLGLANSGVKGSALYPGRQATTPCSQGASSALATSAASFLARLQLEEQDMMTARPGIGQESEGQQEQINSLTTQVKLYDVFIPSGFDVRLSSASGLTKPWTSYVTKRSKRCWM